MIRLRRGDLVTFDGVYFDNHVFLFANKTMDEFVKVRATDTFIVIDVDDVDHLPQKASSTSNFTLVKINFALITNGSSKGWARVTSLKKIKRRKLQTSETL